MAFASSVALARLIPPAEFGRAAIAIAIGAIAYVLVEGMSTPLVQRKELRDEHLQSGALLSLGLGLGLSATAFLAAPVLFEPLFGARTADLVQLVSPVFVAGGLSAVPKAILQRTLDFQRLSAVEVAGLAVGTVTAVALALAGLDAEALVLGVVSTTVSTALFLLVAAPWAPPRWHGRELRETAGFGLPATGASLVYVGYQNVDYAILGAKLSAAQVGFYWRAFQLGAEYQSKISRIMLRVAFPIYSRTRSLEEMRVIRGRIVRLHATLIFPLLLLYIVLAPDLVPWLFGERWEPTVLPSQLLAVAGMTYAVGTGMGAVVLAAGRPRALLANNMASLLLYATVVFFTAEHGLTAVCVGIAVLNVLGLVVTHYLLLQRIAGIHLRELWHDVVPALACGVPLMATAVPLVLLLHEMSAPTLVVLVVPSTTGIFAYALSLRRLFPEQWRDLLLLASRVAGRARPDPTLHRSET